MVPLQVRLLASRCLRIVAALLCTWLIGPSLFMPSPATALVIYTESGSGDLNNSLIGTPLGVGTNTISGGSGFGAQNDSGTLVFEDDEQDLDSFTVTLPAGLELISIFYTVTTLANPSEDDDDAFDNPGINFSLTQGITPLSTETFELNSAGAQSFSGVAFPLGGGTTYSFTDNGPDPLSGCGVDGDECSLTWEYRWDLTVRESASVPAPATLLLLGSGLVGLGGIAWRRTRRK